MVERLFAKFTCCYAFILLSVCFFALSCNCERPQSTRSGHPSLLARKHAGEVKDISEALSGTGTQLALLEGKSGPHENPKKTNASHGKPVDNSRHQHALNINLILQLGPVAFAVVLMGCVAVLVGLDLLAAACLSSGFTTFAVVYVSTIHFNRFCGNWLIAAVLVCVLSGVVKAVRVSGANDDEAYPARTVEFEEGSYEWYRYQVWLVCDEPESSFLAFVKAMVELIFVFWSCVTFSMKSIAALDPDVIPSWKQFYTINEAVLAIFFTFEYTARLWSTRNRYDFAIDYMNVMDVCTFFPWWIQLFAEADHKPINTNYLRALRIFKMFRLMRFAGFSDTLQVIMKAATRSADALLLLLVFLMVGVYMISSLIWEVDAHTYNQKLGCYVYGYATNADGEPDSKVQETCMPYQSVPDAFYYAITTMTTVGYGDVTPVSQRGRMIANIGMICGVLVIAMPVGILSTEFQSVYDEVKEDRELKESQALGKESSDVLKELDILKETINSQLGNAKSVLIKSATDRNEERLASMFKTYCGSMQKELCDKVTEISQVMLEMLPSAAEEEQLKSSGTAA